MMKLLLLALAISTVSCVSKSSCPIYNCSENAPATDLGVCARRDTTGGSVTYTLNKCASGHTCGIQGAKMINASTFMATGTTVNCTKDSSVNALQNIVSTAYTTTVTAVTNVVSDPCDILFLTAVGRVDGQKCAKTSNCYGVLECVDKMCKGKANGQACSADQHCVKGSACIGLVCKNQLGSGEACTNEYDCGNKQTCGASKCVSYNSVAAGTNVITENACSSGYGTRKVATTGSVTYDCATYSRDQNDCTGANDKCTYKWSTGAVVTSACVCKGDFNSTQDRSCADVTTRATSTYSNVHTSLRLVKDINECPTITAALAVKTTYGTCIDKVFGATAFIRNSMIVLLSVLAILF
jgi:hypothetical protein